MVGVRALSALLWVRASLAFVGAAATRQFRATASVPAVLPRKPEDMRRIRCAKRLGLGCYASEFGTTASPNGLNAANSHLDMAHTIWGQVVKPGDVVIDATCGNGADSVALAHLALTDQSGKLYCIDIQECAVEVTRDRLKSALTQQQFGRVEFLRQSHEQFPTELSNVTAVVYNLGYLPKGDKSITTKEATTLKSIQNALQIVRVGGLVSILCYVGHPEGEKETLAVQYYAAHLDKTQWRVFEHRPLNRPISPVLITLYKLA